MKLAMIVRTRIATNVIEYLNSYGDDIHYIFTQPDYFGEKEVSIFEVTGTQEDLEVIQKFLTYQYESSSIFVKPIQLYLEQEEVNKKIEQLQT